MNPSYNFSLYLKKACRLSQHNKTAPKYTGSSPLLRRLINGGSEDAQLCNIGSKESSQKQQTTKINQSINSKSTATCAVAPHHTTPTPLTTPTKRPRSKTLQASVNRLGDLSIKPWRTLWQHEKLTRAFEAVSRASGGIAFTANLSAEREAFLMQRSDPTDDIRRRMAVELRKLFSSAAPVAFAFEVSPKGKLHIHGVAILPASNQANSKVFKEALARACGKSKGKAAARQVDVTELSDGIGWAAYTQKDYDTACHYLGTARIGFIANEIVRLAKG